MRDSSSLHPGLRVRTSRPYAPGPSLLRSIGPLVLAAAAAVALAGCPSPAPSQGAPDTKPEGADTTSGPCLDIRAALVKCREGEAPTHEGCDGPDYMQRCGPAAAPPTTAAPPAPTATGAGQCLDIRAALVRCKDGEVITHEGCPEPEYMKRCAPDPAKKQP